VHARERIQGVVLKGGKMEAFELVRTCPKCGRSCYNGDTPTVEYRVGIWDPMNLENIMRASLGDKPEDYEYLLRTCRWCGYKWPERCVDKET
jgi:hypothetical protein